MSARVFVACGLDLKNAPLQRPGPPPSRPQLTPSPDQRKLHSDTCEAEAKAEAEAEAEASELDTETMSTSHQVRTVQWDGFGS